MYADGYKLACIAISTTTLYLTSHFSNESYFLEYTILSSSLWNQLTFHKPSSNMSSSSRAQRVSYKHLPAHEREEVRRARNAESAKRSRQKKADEDYAVIQSFNENERRIKDLERKVVELANELGSSGTR